VEGAGGCGEATVEGAGGAVLVFSDTALESTMVKCGASKGSGASFPFATPAAGAMTPCGACGGTTQSPSLG
jgi:hypothetical protein